MRNAKGLTGITAMTVIMIGALFALAVSAVPGAAQDGQTLEVDEAKAAYGRTVYRVYCASCHGSDATGDGRIAEYLTIKPSDLTAITARYDGDFPDERLAAIIDGREEVRGHGGEMPVWGDAFQKADALENEPPEVREREVKRKIDSLLQYLRSIQE